jgi:hypothetical protein
MLKMTSSTTATLLSARLGLSSSRPLRRCAVRRRASGVATLTVTAGWFFDNNKDVGGRDPMFEQQQEILRKRRSGNNVEDAVSARRKQVSGFMKGTLGKEETAAIKKKNKDKANALSKEAFEGKGFLPIPGMAIGMPEFDGGERFDLRAPYADEGWVDPDDQNNGISNPFTLGGLFGGNKQKVEPTKTDTEQEASKPKKKGWFGR